MPENYAEHLDELQDAIDTIQEALEEAEQAQEQIDDLTEQLEDLTQRIQDARDDPDSLDADTYADLVTDLMMVIPNNLPLPDPAKKALEALASVVASFIQGATGTALTLLARRFRQLLQTGVTPEEAAAQAANGKAEQAWLLSQYRMGLVTAEGDTRDVKTPTEWLWEKITGIFSSLVGVFTLDGRSPVLLGGLIAVLLLAFLSLFALGLFSGEGEAEVPLATAEPTEAPTEAPTSAPTTEPTAEPTAEPTEALPLVDVLILGGNHYPVDQFVLAEPDNCPGQHWHSRQPVFSLEGTTITADPDPTNCGHGQVSAVPRASVPDTR